MKKAILNNPQETLIKIIEFFNSNLTDTPINRSTGHDKGTNKKPRSLICFDDCEKLIESADKGESFVMLLN